MHNGDDNDDTTDNVFEKAMSDVRPLTYETRISPATTKPAPRPLRHKMDESHAAQNLMSDPVVLSDSGIEANQELVFTRSGLQQKTLKKLRRGEYAIEAELDLHGQKVDEARSQIAEFLTICTQNGYRCVRIIHGKGLSSANKQPILKAHVNHWLRQREEVLAFCSCRPADGGTGAIYLLIKKS